MTNCGASQRNHVGWSRNRCDSEALYSSSRAFTITDDTTTSHERGPLMDERHRGQLRTPAVHHGPHRPDPAARRHQAPTSSPRASRRTRPGPAPPTRCRAEPPRTAGCRQESSSLNRPARPARRLGYRQKEMWRNRGDPASIRPPRPLQASDDRRGAESSHRDGDGGGRCTTLWWWGHGVPGRRPRGCWPGLGHDVLMVDKTRLPSDTLSTHGLIRGGVVQLSRWGLLDRVLEQRRAGGHAGAVRHRGRVEGTADQAARRRGHAGRTPSSRARRSAGRRGGGGRRRAPDRGDRDRSAAIGRRPGRRHRRPVRERRPRRTARPRWWSARTAAGRAWPATSAPRRWSSSPHRARSSTPM